MEVIRILVIVSFLNLSIYASSLHDLVITSFAGSQICKAYAVKVGGDAKIFSEMNMNILKIADKMEYTKDMQSFESDVVVVKNILQKQLSLKYGSKLNIYNDFCVKFYNGYVNGIAKANQL